MPGLLAGHLLEGRDMSNKSWLEIVIVCCTCGFLCLGCARKDKIELSDGDDLLDIISEDGYGMGDRPAEGELITGVRFSNVAFGYDSYRIADSEISKIEEVGDYMRREQGIRLVNEGHCDERGSREYNISLGEHRALAVRAYLIGLGIDGSRVQTRSFGEESPLDGGHSESAWRVNRRVEFALYR